MLHVSKYYSSVFEVLTSKTYTHKLDRNKVHHLHTGRLWIRIRFLEASSMFLQWMKYNQT